MSMTTNTIELSDLMLQLDAKNEEALYWKDQARWCDTLPERTRCEEQQAACEAEAAAIRERMATT